MKDRGPTEESLLNPYFTDERLLKNALMRAEAAIAPTFVHQRPGGSIWHIRSDVWEWTMAEKHRLTCCSLPILGPSAEATDCRPRYICKGCLAVHEEAS